MQFKCCLSSVTKFMYVLGSTVLADLIIWYCTVALARCDYEILYTKREMSISTTCWKKTILLPIQLYSKLLIYYYKLHVSVSGMQGAGD